MSQKTMMVLRERVGLITDHTVIDSKRRQNVDLPAERQDFDLVALFEFEHGLRGEAPPGEKIAPDLFRDTGLPIYSLYGDVGKPTAEMPGGLNVRMGPSIDRLAGTDRVRRAIENGEINDLLNAWEDGADLFGHVRKSYLI